MALIEKHPLTPAQRFHVQNIQRNLFKKRPLKTLLESLPKKGGRNCYGRITSRRRGGGHKRLYRKVDFRREKDDIPARVKTIEYDPNRTANIALIFYADGEKRYILAPKGVKVGDLIISSEKAVEVKIGNNMPLKYIPPATRLHSIELEPKRGAKIARSAGMATQLIAVDEKGATLKMPSGELRLFNSDCRATIGEIGNSIHEKANFGKAGRKRWAGKRPRVRGVAMNPVDHPMGGGEGRTSGGGYPVSPWGQLSKGYPTRPKKKASSGMILIRRNGRKAKR